MRQCLLLSSSDSMGYTLLDGNNNRNHKSGRARGPPMAYSTIGSIRCSFKLLRARAVASHAGQMALIPGTDTEDVFRAKQLPHVALANLLDNEKSVAKFLECYGPLLA